MQSEVFHVSRSSDGKREWYSARDAATGVSIPCECKDMAIALVTSLNSTFKHHLTAALSDKQAGEVKIKPLEWPNDSDWNIATSELGRYVVRPCLATNFSGQWLLRRAGAESSDKTLYPSEDAAKAAAQADYEQRIRSALVYVPAVESEPVAYLRLDNRTDIDGETYTGLQMSDVSDERAFPVYAHPPLREGEDSAEVFARIVAARKAYVEATEAYNARLALVNSERANGNWSMRVDDEARAMWDAQSAFIKAAQDETDAALAATGSASATTAKGGADV
ncbi:hypothetical protein [Shinella oryzae]|uniref:Uncharacterized protein n=1 Tax=Shinella oryzae TaxID=2871820 RepID=A0ABY9JZD7_9HYPH|nr:hypothetical protein [Shinella oryzae]WLS01693.1 hypothetical protein Q9315_09550 [Shinella oryzae]